MENLITNFDKFNDMILLEGFEQEFYVLITHHGKTALVSLSGHNNRWQEKIESGDKIYGLGRNQVGNKEDILRNLKLNFDEVREVSEEELLDLI
jgi:hypothetical protein